MRKGFTLIEILVVLGIIGLLAVFLVPNLMSARDKAKETAVKSVVHTVQLAVEAYEMENQVYPMETSTAVESLCNNYLIPGGYMAKVPNNPFTGAEYKDSDIAGKITYSYNSSQNVYTINAFNRAGIYKILTVSNM
jgi:general secretion pathway protein G